MKPILMVNILVFLYSAANYFNRDTYHDEIHHLNDIHHSILSPLWNAKSKTLIQLFIKMKFILDEAFHLHQICILSFITSIKLTNPRSKSRLYLRFSLKSNFLTTPTPQPQTPEKVSNKQERGLQPKQMLSIYLNRVQILFEDEVED